MARQRLISSDCIVIPERVAHFAGGKSWSERDRERDNERKRASGDICESFFTGRARCAWVRYVYVYACTLTRQSIDYI